MPGIGSSGEKTNFRTLTGILGLKDKVQVNRLPRQNNVSSGVSPLMRIWRKDVIALLS